MFFCESCRVERNWPDSIRQSRGTCEVCGTIATCYTVATKLLPKPPADPERDLEQARLDIIEAVKKMEAIGASRESTRQALVDVLVYCETSITVMKENS